MAEAPTAPNTDAPGSPARTWFLAVAGLLALVLAAGSGGAIYTIRHVEASITKLQTGGDPGSDSCRDPRACIRSVDPQHCYRRACNYLVLGSDSRANLAKSFGTTTRSPGQRSDTIIVVQVDAKKNRTVVLSIPRDLRVEIPGHGLNKINTAFNYGPDVTVQAVEKLTGLSINHYVEVNFLGFEGLVDSLGGIPVCIDRPLVDELAKLHLTHKGCYNLHGAEALAFVRARHIEGDTIPDFSRISRQQQFMRALISKALSAGALLHLPHLIKAVQRNLRLDDGLNLYSLQDLTRKLGEYGQSRVSFRVVPAVPLQIDGVDYLQLINPQAENLFQRIREGRSLGTLGQQSVLTPISPANVTVQVLDAGAPDEAAAVVAFLQRAGFVVLPVHPAPAGLTTSDILWGHGDARPKEVVASYLPDLDVVFDSRNTDGSNVTVVVGPDFPPLEGG